MRYPSARAHITPRTIYTHMKKTLITLAALAMASVAQASYGTNITIDGSYTLNTNAMTEITGATVKTDGVWFNAYSFTFNVVGPTSGDTLIAGLSTTAGSYTYNGLGFVVDGATQSLNVSIYNVNGNSWTATNETARQATFTENGNIVTLTKGYTYTVAYSDETASQASVATLTWTDADLVQHTATATFNGNINGNSDATASAKGYYYASVPEPTTATLSLLALAGLAARRRRK